MEDKEAVRYISCVETQLTDRLQEIITEFLPGFTPRNLHYSPWLCLLPLCLVVIGLLLLCQRANNSQNKSIYVMVYVFIADLLFLVRMKR